MKLRKLLRHVYGRTNIELYGPDGYIGTAFAVEFEDSKWSDYNVEWVNPVSQGEDLALEVSLES